MHITEDLFNEQLATFVTDWNRLYPSEVWKLGEKHDCKYAELRYFDECERLWKHAFITFSRVYDTPQLWFNSYEPGELQKRLALEGAVRSSDWLGRCSEGEHPLLGVAFFYVDPCRISQATKDLRTPQTDALLKGHSVLPLFALVPMNGRFVRAPMNGARKLYFSSTNDTIGKRILNATVGQIGVWILWLWSYVVFLYRRQSRKVAKYQFVTYSKVPMSPLTAERLFNVKRKILVLDLDETLIHSHHDGVVRPMVKAGTPPDFILKVTIERQPVRFFVHLRPHVDYFLTVVSQWYDLVIFTASMEIYGSAVAEKLDKGRGLFSRRYFRQHCTVDYTGYTKDLSSLHPDLSSIFILDNSPAAYRNFTNNAIPIKSWFWDPADTSLLSLLPFLDALRFTSDVRSILSRNQQKQV